MQTTVFIPWRERKAMKFFDEETDYTCVAEDTIGKTYKSTVISIKCVEDEVGETYCTEETCETFLRDLNCDRCPK